MSGILDFGKKKKGPKIELPKVTKGSIMYARDLFIFAGGDAYQYPAGNPAYWITLVLGKLSQKTSEPSIVGVKQLLGEIGMVSLDDVAEALGESEMYKVLDHITKKYDDTPATEEEQNAEVPPTAN